MGDWHCTYEEWEPLTCKTCGEDLGMLVPVGTATDFNVIKAEHLKATHNCQATPRQLRDAANRRWEK